MKLPSLPPCSFSLLRPYFDPCPERLNSSLTSHGRERFQFGITRRKKFLHPSGEKVSRVEPIQSSKAAIERSAAFADEL